MLIAANGQYPNQLRQWTSDVAKEFRAMTGADVRFEQYASAADEQRIIQLSVVSGNGPDVYVLGTTFAPVAAATGGFVVMDDARWNQIGGRGKFVPATLAMSGTDRNSEVAIPLEGRPFLMAYNTKLFGRAGIDLPKTWDGVVAAAKQLTSAGRYGLGIAYGDSYDPWKFVWTFASQYGNPLVRDGRALLSDPRVERAYEAHFGFLTSDKVVDPASVGWQSALPPGDTALPSGGIAAASIVSGDNMVVAEYSKHQDLAFEFI